MNEKHVYIHYTFGRSPEQVFNAWVNPEWIRKWLFKSPKNQIVQVINDPTPLGVFSILGKNEKGELIDHFGKYYVIEKPRSLSFCLTAPARFRGTAVVDVTMEANEQGGCELMLYQNGGFDPETFEKSWRRMFMKLERLLSGS